MRAHRPHHAERTAESQAASLLPHLRPGMDLVDLGCGPCTITAGFVPVVSPARVVGVDLDPGSADGVEVVTADVTDLPFPDASFDAIFASTLLQHLPRPIEALREARRIARPGAVIGVVDADWDGELLYPDDAVLQRSMELARRLRTGTSPGVGKQLRHLLTEAGFTDPEASARVLYHGTAEEARDFGAFNASLFQLPAAVERAVADGLATTATLAEMSEAWIAWGEHPGAFVARFWCEAVAWAP
jgi:SAM-dependent methyltransferase